MYIKTFWIVNLDLSIVRVWQCIQKMGNNTLEEYIPHGVYNGTCRPVYPGIRSDLTVHKYELEVRSEDIRIPKKCQKDSHV